ncbi:AraC family transcriptional regulator [Bordetella hinzii]|nr:AraC family transcriptional regulator [Bordetella hinzii]QDJ44134.1 AraC family transcriptional regulator [Bordetella hinzii]QDJ48658.1 AraC family transcriptional regulator [Bordetella hinzii]QDJ53150.1 AraC family transcriptional regulator [Bordetella hinzii]QDJ57591.1 AraC family transcriptional regulator [Bordetella hinzii]
MAWATFSSSVTGRAWGRGVSVADISGGHGQEVAASVPRSGYSVSLGFDENYREMDKRPPTAPIIRVGYPDAPGVVTRRREMAADFHIEPHWHERAQLLYASHGVMRVSTPRRLWLVPPTRALWIPARVVHEIRMGTAVDMRSLYIDASLLPGMPADCAVLEVTPLMRELVVRVSETPPRGGPDHELLSALLLKELSRLPPRGFDLPLPESASLRALCEALLADPSLGPSPDQAAARLGVSARTLYRRFLEETGLSYVRWAQQARLLEAVRRLAEGQPVTTVALDLGYQSPSAFTAMFRRQLGRPPRRWR